MTELSTPQMTLTALQGLAVNVGETVRPALMQAEKKPQASSTPKAFVKGKTVPRKTKTVSVVDDQRDDEYDKEGGYYVDYVGYGVPEDSGALLYMEDGSVSMVEDSTSQASSSIAPPSRSWVSGSLPPQRPGMRFGPSGGPP